MRPSVRVAPRGGGRSRALILREGEDLLPIAADDVRAELLKIRAQIDDLLVFIGGARAKALPVGALYMTPQEYAKRRKVAVGTVRRWIKLGLPHSQVGRVTRIKVSEADAWQPDSAVAETARVAARRGVR